MAQSTDSEYGGDEKGHEKRHKMGQTKIGGIRGSWKLMGGPGGVVWYCENFVRSSGRIYRRSEGHEKKMLKRMTKMLYNDEDVVWILCFRFWLIKMMRLVSLLLTKPPPLRRLRHRKSKIVPKQSLTPSSSRSQS